MQKPRQRTACASCYNLVKTTLLSRAKSGGTEESFTRGGSVPRSKPLPLYMPFLTGKVILLCTFHRKWYSLHITQTGWGLTPRQRTIYLGQYFNYSTTGPLQGQRYNEKITALKSLTWNFPFYLNVNKDY